jgi:pimeloyl-ACP methyl ester carboxylesterase
MNFKTLNIDGVNIAYREAGKPGLPKLVLLHGFPASSHQYRNLMPALEKHFHIIAPDYPGFGNSDIPDPAKFHYTFDHLSEIIESLLMRLDFMKFGLYVQDYGGPVGFRILDRHPDWLEWLIIQNTNAYEEGFTEVWAALRGAYWESRDAKAEQVLTGFLEFEVVKQVYTQGHPDPTAISPDNWNMDLHFLARPHAKQVQLDLFYDYRTNVALYPKWQKFLRDHEPKTIIFWGQDDIFFTRAGGEAFKRDLPNAPLHRLNSGHFALEDNLQVISNQMIEFYNSQ